MRIFIVFCFSTITLAAPQSYSYNFINPMGFNANSGAHSFPAVMPHSYQSNPSDENNGELLHPSGFNQPGIVTNQGLIGPTMAHSQQGQQKKHPPSREFIVSKRFFIHSAPEDEEQEYKEKYITVGVPKKNYNVVFIKAPSGSSRQTSIKIRPAVNEEKTVIYVLSKKTDATDVHAEIVDQSNTTSKPEVFFVKYKTNEEAAYAQEQIQAQYNVLGGSSQLTDEGFAPVSSVIGSLGVNAGASVQDDIGKLPNGGIDKSSGKNIALGGASQHSEAVGSHSNSAYLPPIFY